MHLSPSKEIQKETHNEKTHRIGGDVSISICICKKA
jgi:hypothetical protein